MSSQPKTECSSCHQLLTGHGKNTTGMCLDCWRVHKTATKIKYKCKDCQGPCSETGAKGQGRCRSCAQKIRAATVGSCLDCGIVTKQHAARCRSCWLRHLSAVGMTERMAQGRATALKTKVRVSKAELQMEELLDHFGLRYERSAPYQGWILDFVLIGYPVVIEVHGAYWHDKPSAIERDQRKRVALEYDGYQVIFARTDQMHFWWTSLLSVPALSFLSTTSPLPVSTLTSLMGS